MCDCLIDFHTLSSTVRFNATCHMSCPTNQFGIQSTKLLTYINIIICHYCSREHIMLSIVSHLCFDVRVVVLANRNQHYDLLYKFIAFEIGLNMCN